MSPIPIWCPGVLGGGVALPTTFYLPRGNLRALCRKPKSVGICPFSSCISCLSLYCGQILNKKHLKRWRVHFGSQLEELEPIMVGKGTEAGAWGSWPYCIHSQEADRGQEVELHYQTSRLAWKGSLPPARPHLLKLPLSSKTSGDQVPNTKASEWVSFTFKPQHSSYPVCPYPEKEAGRLHHSEITRVLWFRGVILNNKDLRDLMPSLTARSLASASLWNVPALNPTKVLICFWQAASVSACLFPHIRSYSLLLKPPTIFPGQSHSYFQIPLWCKCHLCETF